ncbi:nucleotidyltransferase domain protein [Amycolatopsis methanolica 239]|uniref:Nucleotidyltransferase domain protein n=1 Tax=Amycolatopsis methanolica 239 TaxID=1068978 RepID=A0A076MZP2_AMYME|nr:nucleotidyltransferase domain protein [Amycolatopsis methanolica 239]
MSEIGGWGGGVFNGGAWLTIDGRGADVHYRDLDVVEHELAEAREGRFHWEPLMFHLAGIPSYLVVAELAVNRVLRGSLPEVEFPEVLRKSAPAVWRAGFADADLRRAQLRAARAGDRVRGRARHGGDAGRARGAGRAWRVGAQREAPARPHRPARRRLADQRGPGGGRPAGP